MGTRCPSYPISDIRYRTRNAPFIPVKLLPGVRRSSCWCWRGERPHTLPVRLIVCESFAENQKTVPVTRFDVQLMLLNVPNSCQIYPLPFRRQRERQATLSTPAERYGIGTNAFSCMATCTEPPWIRVRSAAAWQLFILFRRTTMPLRCALNCFRVCFFSLCFFTSVSP